MHNCFAQVFNQDIQWGPELDSKLCSSFVLPREIVSELSQWSKPASLVEHDIYDEDFELPDEQTDEWAEMQEHAALLEDE